MKFDILVVIYFKLYTSSYYYSTFDMNYYAIENQNFQHFVNTNIFFNVQSDTSYFSVICNLRLHGEFILIYKQFV